MSSSNSRVITTDSQPSQSSQDPFTKWYHSSEYPYMDVVNDSGIAYLSAADQTDWMIVITRVKPGCVWVVRRSKYDPYDGEEHVVELYTKEQNTSSYNRVYYNPFAGESSEIKRVFPEFFHKHRYGHMFLTEDDAAGNWTISPQNQLDWTLSLDRSTGLWIVQGTKGDTQEETLTVYDVPFGETRWKCVYDHVF